MTRRIGSRRTSSATAASCDHVRQAISARFDGEAPGLPRRDTDAHLARCGECRNYLAALIAVNRSVALEVSRPVPAALKQVLAAEWAHSVRPVPRPARKASSGVGRSTIWRRRLQWASALTPALLLAVALPLGALSSPHEVPSHARTPCTIDLASLRGAVHP